MLEAAANRRNGLPTRKGVSSDAIEYDAMLALELSLATRKLGAFYRAIALCLTYLPKSIRTA